MKYCRECGAEINEKAVICVKCGCEQERETTQILTNPNGEIIRNKWIYFALAILLGGWGGHKFYENKFALGIIYFLFSWTFIPLIIAFIEGIVMLAKNPNNTEYIVKK